MSSGDGEQDGNAAALQITAEKIVHESLSLGEKPLHVREEEIRGAEEFGEYQRRKRTEYEEALRRKRNDLRQWMRYAQWEVEQKEFERARSIFERALAVDYTFVPLWLRYAQTELKEKNYNHARNVLVRATKLLPRVNKLWYMYVGLEETLGDLEEVRFVFEQWLSWMPEKDAWNAYISFEKRCGKYDHCRDLFQRFAALFPVTESWDAWAKFEDEFGNPENAREVYSQAVDLVIRLQGVEAVPPELLASWANWEANSGETDRARALYKFGLSKLPSEMSTQLLNSYAKLEKKYGDKDALNSVVFFNRQNYYETALRTNPRNYDIWWSLISLLELGSSEETVRSGFRRAIKNQPLDHSKDAWRRYVYLCIRFAVFEETKAAGEQSAREIYEELLNILPHKQFTFAKVWVLFAKFEIRHGNLAEARKLLGRALGISGKPKLFKEYIAIEQQLGDISRCRILYEKFLEKHPMLSNNWITYAMFESDLGEHERSRAIFELALSTDLNDAQSVWLAYAEYEADEGNFDCARAIYDRLLMQLRDPQLWVTYAMFEVSTGMEDDETVDDEALERTRRVFSRADEEFKNEPTLRVAVHDARVQFEETYGTEDTAAAARTSAPRAVEKERQMPDGTTEVFTDYIFPDTERMVGTLMANARKWAASREN